MISINEYKDKHNLTNGQLAKLLGVSDSTAQKYTYGDRASRAVKERAEALGIKLACKESKSDLNNQKQKKQVVEVKFKSKILKEFQVVAVETTGTMIVSKKYSVEDIVKEYSKFGLEVKVRKFKTNNFVDKDTHYVVEKVGMATC